MTKDSPRALRRPLGEKVWDWVVVDRGNGCWEWAGHISANGYGNVWSVEKRAPLRAHRVVYELVKGAIPDGLCLDHLCRNRACVNPDHLEPVTHHENCLRGARDRRLERMAAA